MIALRRETFDFGILPASFLVPRAESVASLAPIQRRLLQCAYPSRADPAQTVVTLTDAAQALGITHTNAAHVIGKSRCNEVTIITNRSNHMPIFTTIDSTKVAAILVLIFLNQNS